MFYLPSFLGSEIGNAHYFTLALRNIQYISHNHIRKSAIKQHSRKALACHATITHAFKTSSGRYTTTEPSLQWNCGFS